MLNFNAPAGALSSQPSRSPARGLILLGLGAALLGPLACDIICPSTESPCADVPKGTKAKVKLGPVISSDPEKPTGQSLVSGSGGSGAGASSLGGEGSVPYCSTGTSSPLGTDAAACWGSELNFDEGDEFTISFDHGPTGASGTADADGVGCGLGCLGWVGAAEGLFDGKTTWASSLTDSVFWHGEGKQVSPCQSEHNIRIAVEAEGGNSKGQFAYGKELTGVAELSATFDQTSGCSIKRKATIVILKP